MEFDLLVRKYLRGTLSASELERLRDMLERVPEYRTELRQILDLRSIIHDDVLRLIPPSELSDYTRETVGARFAGIESLLHNDANRIETPDDLADATRSVVGQLFAAAATSRANTVDAGADTGTDVEQGAVVNEVDASDERRRRAVILPYRIAGRMLLAASIAVMIALAPTALTPTLDQSAGGLANGFDVFRSGSILNGAPVDGRSALGERSGNEIALASVVNSSLTITSDGAVISDGSTPRSTSERAIASVIAPEPSVNDAAVDAPRDDQPASLVLDPDNPLSNIPMRGVYGGLMSSYNPAVDSFQRRQEPPLAVVTFAPGDASASDDGRFLSVGVTLGSGNVIDADAPAALMQNSYYFAFNVSNDDRIGIEMGGSTFMQETTIPGKRPLKNVFAKQDPGDTGATAVLVDPRIAPPSTVRRMKQDITYGGVFYDRRLEVDNKWDVCMRTTFGAADGAIVTGVRAYTAFTPTKNVTLTLGIGGSKLFSLTRGTADGSTNYGLYYGVETGF